MRMKFLRCITEGIHFKMCSHSYKPISSISSFSLTFLDVQVQYGQFVSGHMFVRLFEIVTRLRDLIDHWFAVGLLHHLVKLD